MTPGIHCSTISSSDLDCPCKRDISPRFFLKSNGKGKGNVGSGPSVESSMVNESGVVISVIEIKKTNNNSFNSRSEHRLFVGAQVHVS